MIRARWLAAACSAATFAHACPARAQVNTEVLRKRIKLSGYSAIVEESVAGDLGNSQGISLGGGLGGGWARAPHLFFAYARVDYTKYAGVVSVDKSFAHARYNYEFNPLLWGEAFAQAQTDQFQRLDVRNLLGVGPRVRVAHSEIFDPTPAGTRAKAPYETFDLYFGSAYMFERDAIRPTAGSTGPQNQTIQVWHRWSSYVTLQWQIDPRAIISTTAYVQPAINLIKNVRFLDDTLFSFHVTKVFAAGVSASVRYDSDPPTGVLRADLDVKNTLGVTF